jgi:hypothetical protein
MTMRNDLAAEAARDWDAALQALCDAGQRLMAARGDRATVVAVVVLGTGEKAVVAMSGDPSPDQAMELIARLAHAQGAEIEIVETAIEERQYDA